MTMRLNTFPSQEPVGALYCSYESAPNLVLTTTPQRVNAFTELISPNGVTYDDGVFSVLKDGLIKFDMERVYINTDTNPTDPIILNIDVRVNGETLFSRTATISTATANDEPATLSYTTPVLAEFKLGDDVELYTSASMNGANPVDTELVRFKVVAMELIK